MSDQITVQGVVLSAMPIGEYDKRVVLLTRERGKISAFAKGARRLNSPLMAASNPFVFGVFTLYEGRTSNSLVSCVITHHFADLSRHQPEVYYGFYFLEIADYFGKEGLEERDTLNLLYVVLKALMRQDIDVRLVRCIYELRMLCEQGLAPQLNACAVCQREEAEEWFFSQEQNGVICIDDLSASQKGSPKGRKTGLTPLSPLTLAVMRYIAFAPIQKLCAFSVGEETISQLEDAIYPYTQKNIDRKMKSLQFLEIFT